MVIKTDRSKELFERALKVLVEGGSSPSRGPANYGDYPLFIKRGEGATIEDVDGNRYIDWMMAYGALPLGHAHPLIVEAISEAASTGTLFAAATEVEIEVAELISGLVPGAEKVRFANTGTEATMAAIRLARGFTGRPRFINDPVKIPDSSGLNRRALEDTIVIPWNDLEAVERAISNYRGSIAAVITEGIMANIGVIPPADGYLQGLRELTRANDILLILDETVTGCRIAPGGCQELYGVDADIVTMGKGLGAGLPVAAFAGRGEIMEALAWGGVLHYGTQNASRAGMFASRVNLTELSKDDGAAFKRLWEIGESLTGGLNRVFEETGTAAIAQGVGPMLQILFTERSAITDFREFCAHVDRGRYQRFALSLFEHGIYMTPSSALHSVASLAHSDEDIAVTLEAVRTVLSS